MEFVSFFARIIFCFYYISDNHGFENEETFQFVKELLGKYNKILIDKGKKLILLYTKSIYRENSAKYENTSIRKINKI